MSNQTDLYIQEVKNAVPLDFCKEVIKRRINHSSDPFADIVYWTDKDKHSEWSNLSLHLDNFLSSHIDKYLDQFNSSLSHKDIEYIGFALVRQPAGAYDVQHFDTPLVVNTNSFHYRPFVCLIYLNGEEIEGGQLIFPAQSRVIGAEAGKVLIFPCSYMYPHRVATIATGERFFIRLNYKFKSDKLVDFDLDNWDISKDGIQRSNEIINE